MADRTCETARRCFEVPNSRHFSTTLLAYRCTQRADRYLSPERVRRESEEGNTRISGSAQVTQKTVSIRGKFKLPAVSIQIQPFLRLKEPEISLESPKSWY